MASYSPKGSMLSKELRAQLPWLGVWLIAFHSKALLFLLGLIVTWASGGMPGEYLGGPFDAFLHAAFLTFGPDSGAITLLLVGIFFYAGGYQVFHGEIRQRTIGWLNTMPVADRSVAGMKLLASGLYVFLAAAPGCVFWTVMMFAYESHPQGRGAVIPFMLYQWVFAALLMYAFYLIGATIGIRRRAASDRGQTVLRAGLLTLGGLAAVLVALFMLNLIGALVFPLLREGDYASVIALHVAIFSPVCATLAWFAGRSYAQREIDA